MICEICEEVFEEKVQGVKTVCRKAKCRDEYRKWNSNPNVECVICNKAFYLKPSSILEFNCCSKECLRKRRKTMCIGEGNPNFNNRGSANPLFVGVRDRKYRSIYCPKHPFNREGYVMEHRLVAEKYLLNNENSILIKGEYYLKEGYEVHHKDEDKFNNDKSNLMVLTKSEHRSLHNTLKPQKRSKDNGRFIK